MARDPKRRALRATRRALDAAAVITPADLDAAGVAWREVAPPAGGAAFDADPLPPEQDTRGTPNG